MYKKDYYTKKNIADMIANLEKIEKRLKKKLNETDLKILNDRLITLNEIIINREISSLRSELEKNIFDKKEKYIIYEKISRLKKRQIEKDDLDNMYKLRYKLINQLEYISIKISDLRNYCKHKNDIMGG